ncbi:polysaccharide deacetylase family protein [Massilia sp. TS11]|uniref:polysaccharide deacetylase family protein n=1 Tax=Massilia sp. TS11 TaxID=2908003 RepID=UPI001EDA9AA5|nr:polysaccharide deacetylase family protein [Massilia sp. TS11]MCG2583944.1 polysaccharide deacetylase family protein [Massilia sp. TS11]
MTPQAAPPAFEIVITVDDLPAHGPLPPGMSRLGIAEQTLAVLKAHGVPEAWGFVNAKRLTEDPATEQVLLRWRQAGYPLGNHTHSHLNIDRAPSQRAWEADVEAGEGAIARHMPGDSWRVFRYPNLNVGSVAERRAAAQAYLRAKGYRIADVSVAFSDWDYTDAYARCLARGDQASIAQMTRAYLANVDAGILRMRAMSQRVYGRQIPQVLLTHLGGFSAITLDAVLSKLDAAGARYITLAQAQRDPAYAEAGGGSVMSRAAQAQSSDLSGLPTVPDSSAARQMCK